MKKGGVVFCLILALGVPGCRNQNSESRAHTPRVRVFRLEYRVKLDRLPSDAERVRMWVPVAESGPYQEVSVRVEGDFPLKPRRDLTIGNKLLYAELRKPKKENLEVRLEFTVRRREKIRYSQGNFFSLTGLALPEFSLTDGAAIEKAPHAKWLQPNRLVPTGGRIREISQEVCRGLSTPLEKAQAIYNYVFDNMAYDKSGQGWGRGDALYACDAKKGNCTDFHALFIGLLRAQGIPAKFEIGFQIPAARGRGEVPGYHCWAEFYLEGGGWIPVDISEAWKRPARREYFFGAHDENRVLFSRGRDLRLSPEAESGAVNFFVYPLVEVDGRRFTRVAHEFFYEDLPGDWRPEDRREVSPGGKTSGPL